MINKEAKYLKERIYEQLKKGIHSEFLSPSELQIILPFLNRKKLSYHIFSLFPDCEKVILYREKEPELVCFQIVAKHIFRHQDILGSVFSHQIRNHVFGDIVFLNNYFYITILSSMKSYFESFFTTIGTYSITLKEVPLETVSQYQYQFIEKKVIVPNMRIDAVIAKIIGTSRRIVLEKLLAGDILLNYQTVTKKSADIKEGDILSIRKNGKYQIAKFLDVTKKGNQMILIKKYCSFL